MLLFNQVRLTEEPPVFLGGWGEDTGVQVSTLLRLRPPCCLCDHKGVLCRDPSSFWGPPPPLLLAGGAPGFWFVGQGLGTDCVHLVTTQEWLNLLQGATK